MNQLICNDVITLSAQGIPECASGWLTQIASLPFDLTQIDPSVATMMFGAGWILPLTPWVASWGIGQLLKAIRRF